MTRTLEIPVQKASQQIGTFYIGSHSAYEILEACRFDFRRIQERGGYKDFLGIQRELSTRRVKDIAQYITTKDSVFPTAVVLSADARCVTFKKENGQSIMVLSEYQDSSTSEINIPFEDIFSIIDGQHRLAAFKELKEKIPFDLPLSIFVDIDDATEAEIFSTVNLAQTKVNKSLVYDLFSLADSRSPEKTCHEIVVNLDRLPQSPFFGKIKRLGTATEGRFGETLSQATLVRGILPYITNDALADRDIGKRVGHWDEISARQGKIRIFYEFFRRNSDEYILKILLNYFNAIRKQWPDAWDSKERGSMISRTNGFNAFIRFLRPAYLSCSTSNEVVSEEQFLTIFGKTKLTDEHFTSERYVPGSSGSTALYNDLISQTGLG